MSLLSKQLRETMEVGLEEKLQVISEKLIHHECQRLPKYKIQKFHILLWNSKTCFIFIGYKQGGGKRLGFNGICESKFF